MEHWLRALAVNPVDTLLALFVYFVLPLCGVAYGLYWLVKNIRRVAVWMMFVTIFPVYVVAEILDNRKTGYEYEDEE